PERLEPQLEVGALALLRYPLALVVQPLDRDPAGDGGMALLERRDGGPQRPVHHRHERPQRLVEVERDDRRRHAAFRSRATAWQAAPSPRPANPRWSVVEARTVTRERSAPRAAARHSRIASRCGARRGACMITIASTFTSAHPAARTRSQARPSRAMLDAPASAGSSDGNRWPMSSIPAAPRRASVTAWLTRSASE